MTAVSVSFYSKNDHNCFDCEDASGDGRYDAEDLQERKDGTEQNFIELYNT